MNSEAGPPDESPGAGSHPESQSEAPPPPVHKRRPRYSGKNPRRFQDKYKELNPEQYPEQAAKVIAVSNARRFRFADSPNQSESIRASCVRPRT